MTAGGATAFLSGDINNLCGAEDALASELGHVDFLKLGHYGFNNPNSIGYIKALSPKFVFQTGRYSTMREELVRALCEIGSRYYSSADVVNDGSAAFEVSLSSAGVTTNGEYCIPRLGANSSFGAPSLPLASHCHAHKVLDLAVLSWRAPIDLPYNASVRLKGSFR